MQKEPIYCSNISELDDDFTIDLKKIIFALRSRISIILTIFTITLLLFILLTFITPKKYTVDADLYINKSNNSNMAEINPYVIAELGAGSGMAAMLAGGNSALTNEIELIKSPLVLDKVIRENNIIYKKRWGIIPNPKEGEYVSAEALSNKKGLQIEVKKGTNVISIKYTSRNPKLSHDIVSSTINNYIALHKELNSTKSKSDKKILEQKYIQAKDSLNKKMNTVNGLPENALNMSGNLSAMSAFSKPVESAMSSLKAQVLTGAKSRAEVVEGSAKVAELAKRLEWAKLVDEMSDSSKVIILKEPKLLEKYENTSPKLLINIIVGIILGAIFGLIAAIIKENTDKKLAYSMLGDKVIYDINQEINKLKMDLLIIDAKKSAIITLADIPENIIQTLAESADIKVIKFNISKDFINQIKDINNVLLFAKINETDSNLYKQAKFILTGAEKNIIEEVLV